MTLYIMLGILLLVTTTLALGVILGSRDTEKCKARILNDLFESKKIKN